MNGSGTASSPPDEERENHRPGHWRGASCALSALLLLCLLLHASATAASLVEINPPKLPPANHLTAIVGVSLFDVQKSALLTGAVVIIRGDRIAEIGRVGSTPVPPNAAVIDGRGLTLLPG